ncbi:GNAT family N-acetyltransferase [Tepidibacter formicigenes]|jgi:predicted acetyltransferase|uniref:Acetyltransferase (GNAT) domain-containing protein n=1 Tax=Tepidibacter formicigenes DSM 15518 TaxID=1123349 RepID=A0A1M6KIW3_9FIRM|nr:GNAT family N-acetyltransferase [Tepidibacter formicigenes]SHJ58887.1 Acetyltransferase (GNAT) domain-containing protein [Tepidibacter formicigenes DSM 15518]
MQGPRGTKREEFKDVINLINNIFRISNGHNPTMEKEFPLLLNENNIDNMRIIIEDGKVVSGVNFFKEDIFIEGSIIKAASIGGVCTHKDYRKRGYSSLILDDVEKKMYEDNIDIVLISGTRGLYKRRNCIEVKNFYKYTIKPKNIDIDIEVVDYKEDYLNEISDMYNQNSTRYYRTYEEFEILLEAATIPWGTYTYKKYVLIKDEKLLGYIVLRIIDEDIKYGQVIESFGNPEIIFKVLSNICLNLELDNIKYYVHIKDKINQLMDYFKKEKTYLHGTVKIINFLSFMENLRNYFIQHVPKSLMDKIKFKEDEEGYYFEIENEVLKIKDIKILTQLVFEGYDINLEDKPKIKKFLNSVFPIPFIWTANLNYQ